MTRLTAVLICVFAGVGALAVPAQATFPGANGKIAFTALSPDVDHGCLHTVNPDGGGMAPVTTCDPIFAENDPAWSADGRRLAYNLIDFDPKIMAITDGGASTAIGYPGLPMIGLSWSPDGSKLVTSIFHVGDDGGTDALFVLDVAGGGFTNLLDDACCSVDWSPDGAKIAFDGIETVAPGGTGRSPVTGGGGPSWSPDGAKLAFVRANDVWTANANGTGQVRLTNSPGELKLGTAWSPDGTKIAFSSTRDASQTCRVFSSRPCSDIHVINADGTGETNLTKTATVSEFSPDWQPLPGPRRADYKNQSAFCRAERDFLGEQAFRAKYGGNGNGANAHGRCVSGK